MSWEESFPGGEAYFRVIGAKFSAHFLDFGSEKRPKM